MVDWTGKEAYEAEVRKYFLCCPICGADSLNVSIISCTTGGADNVSCNNCGSKWHIYLGNWTGSLSWAELELTPKSGEGKTLLGKRFNKDEIKAMAQAGRINGKDLKINSNTINEKEVIREKEILIKLRCPYCKTAYDERLSNCPECGAKN